MGSEKTLSMDSSPQPNQATGHKSNKNSSNRAGKSSNPKKEFKGTTPELEGFVFNVSSEQKREGEFNEVIDRIRAYSARLFPGSMRYLSTIFDHHEEPIVPRPDIVVLYGENPDDVDKMGYVEDIKDWRKQVRKLNEAISRLFEIVWGQCSQSMRVRLEGTKNFKYTKESCDLLNILKHIKSIYYQFDHRISCVIAIDICERKVLNCWQQPHEPVPVYMRKLNNAIERLEHHGGELAPPPILIDFFAKKHCGIDPDATAMEKYYVRSHRIYKLAKEARYAICAIARSDPKRFGVLVQRLKNNYAFGTDHYPITRNQAGELLMTFVPETMKGGGNKSSSNMPGLYHPSSSLR